MKKLLIGIVLCGVYMVYIPSASGQALNRTVGSVTCAVSGSSTQVVTAKASRVGLIILNTAGKSVWLAPVVTGTPNLSGTNAIFLTAGQTFSDQTPDVFLGRYVCMSSDGTTATIYFLEKRK